MKLDFNVKLKSLNDDNLKDDKGKEVTLGSVCVEALLLNYSEEGPISGEEKKSRWDLASKISKVEPTEMVIEEVALIKKLIGRAYGAAVVGPAYTLLEGT